MLRKIFKSDMPELLAIEKSVHVVPWTLDTFKLCFQPGYAGWAIELDKKAIGFIIVSLTAEECHILNLCVARPFQHQGFGRQLLEYAIAEAKHLGVSIAYLEVRRSNTRAIGLYRKMAFHVIGERKNYYPTLSIKQEDALIFAKSLLAPIV